MTRAKKRYLFLDPTGDPLGHAKLKEASKLSYDSHDWSSCTLSGTVFTGYYSKKFKSYIVSTKESQLDAVISSVKLFVDKEIRDVIRTCLEKEHQEWRNTKKFSAEACLAIPRVGPLSCTELLEYWDTLTKNSPAQEKSKKELKK